MFDFNMWIRLLKTRYSNVDEAIRENGTVDENESELFDFIHEVWDTIEPITWEEAFAQTEVDVRRLFFTYLGPAKLFNALEKKKLVDTYIAKDLAEKYNQDVQGHTYQLWQIDASQLKLQGVNHVYVVQCWCPSTLKECIIFVDHREDFCLKPNAKEAIAWTCRSPIPVNQIKKILRQGEVYTFIDKKSAEYYENLAPAKRDETNFVHLTGKQYFELIGQQT
jgi:hypothetical protein